MDTNTFIQMGGVRIIRAFSNQILIRVTLILLILIMELLAALRTPHLCGGPKGSWGRF